MKHNVKYVISLVFMLLFTQGAWADPTITIIKQLDGEVPETSPGEVTPVIEDGTCTLTVTPGSGTYVTKDFITVYSVVTGNVAQAPRRSPNLDNDPIEVSDKGENTDPTGVTTYEFVMPDDGSDVEVTINFHSYLSYALFIGETQVTELNASDIFGDNKVTFTPGNNANNNVNTLTLNGATLTVPVKVALPNLTIDIQGTNSITTEETCLQRINDGAPAVTFKSTGDEVGSLILTTTGSNGVNSIGRDNVGSFSFSNQFAVMLTVYGTEDYTSNTYYFTDGSTTAAKIVPSLGVQVGEMQVYAGNATNVLGDEGTPTVVFDAENHKLTLNGAHISGAISTSLENLIIELVGNNTLYQGSSYAALQSSTGDAVTMTIQSTGETKGNLTMTMPFTQAGTFADEHVTLSITTPLTVVSGSLTGNTSNENTVVIDEPYGLTVAGVIVSNANASAITGNQIFLSDGGSVSYNYQKKTLTLNKVNFYVTSSEPIIVSSRDSLTVNIVGSVLFNFNDIDPAYVFQSTNEDAVLTFVTTDTDNPNISIPSGIESGAFTGFKKVDYKNGLALSTEEGDFPAYTIGLMAAPIFSGLNIDQETGLLTGNIITEGYDGATIKYAITYADGVHQDVPETTYSESLTLEGPATLTAYITVGESQSPVATAKYFGFTESMKVTYMGQDEEMPSLPALIPAIADGDDVTCEIGMTSNEDVVTHYEDETLDMWLVKGVGTAVLDVYLGTGDDTPYQILNEVAQLTVNVVPMSPEISPYGGMLQSNQKIELAMPEAYSGAAADIWYTWGDGSDSTIYQAPIDVEEGTLKAWTIVTVEQTGYKSDIAEAQFTFFSDATAEYTIGGNDNPDLPILNNGNGLTVTYSSSNTAVATVDEETGVVTPVGVGEATITATSEATAEFAAGQTSYVLTVKKDLSHESITVTVEDAIYNGDPVYVDVTVMDGETDITDYVLAMTEDSEVGQATVTITPKDLPEAEGTNYYVGQTSATFNIVYRTLTVGEDVVFADGQTWATYYDVEENLNLPEGVNAYVVTDVEGSTVTLQAISYIPVYEPVLLELSETKPSNIAESMEDVDGWNWLCGTDDETDVSEMEGTVYVLYNGMFVKSTSGTIPSYKAYLLVDRPEAPQYLYFNFDTTSVSEKLREKSEEFATAQWYSLDGRKLSGSPAKKGVYILNGKKMVVK